MASRETANLMAAAAFFVVLAIGVWVVGTNHGVEHPTTTTVVTKSAVAASATSRGSTQVVFGPNGHTKTRTTTKTSTTAPGSPQSTETTTVDGSRSFIERILGDNGVVFLQIGAVLLAAFIAGAAIQRVLVGQYGGLKVGSLGVSELAPEVAELSGKSIKELEAALAAFQQESKTKFEEVGKSLEATRRESRVVDSELSNDLYVITSRLREAEKKNPEDGP